MRSRSLWLIPESFRSLSLAWALLLVASLLPLGATSASAQDITTRVQFHHAGTGTGMIEVRVNGEEVLDEFQYGDTSDWSEFDPGAVHITITADRAGFNYLLLDTVYPAPAGNDYYAVISDVLVLAGAFDRSEVPADASRVQVLQASVDTPAVNVVATGAEADLATGLMYPQSSEAAELPAGTYDLEFTLADSGESVLTASGIVVEAGKSYQFVLVGTPGDEDRPLEVVVLETDLVAGGGATPQP